MKTSLISCAICIFLSLAQVLNCEETAATAESAEQKTAPGLTEAQSPELSRVRRSFPYDMRRLGRGLQMLRLGKRQMPMLRLGRSPQFPEQASLEELLNALDNKDGNYGYYYSPDEEEGVPEESDFHLRKRRSAETLHESAASQTLFTDSSKDVKRSVDNVQEPLNALEGGNEEDEPQEEGEDGDIEKRPMNMLRLGKRPMNMLRLGKRPMNMLRLGKRPMNMLRLGKRPMNMLRLGKRPMNILDDREEGPIDEENFEEPEEEEEEDDELSADKRPMNMLRLGKRPMNMLRLGKRPMNMLRLGKRPMNMLRLGKRPMNMLRLGKRSTE